MTEIEKDYEDLKKLAKKGGIIELSTILNEYNDLIELSSEYFQQMKTKYSVSTSSSTCK